MTVPVLLLKAEFCMTGHWRTVRFNSTYDFDLGFISR